MEGNKVKKQRTKIPVKKYTEIDDTLVLNDVKLDEGTVYITNEGGKQYLVEVWA